MYHLTLLWISLVCLGYTLGRAHGARHQRRLHITDQQDRR